MLEIFKKTILFFLCVGLATAALNAMEDSLCNDKMDSDGNEVIYRNPYRPGPYVVIHEKEKSVYFGSSWWLTPLEAQDVFSNFPNFYPAGVENPPTFNDQYDVDIVDSNTESSPLSLKVTNLFGDLMSPLVPSENSAYSAFTNLAVRITFSEPEPLSLLMSRSSKPFYWPRGNRDETLYLRRLPSTYIPNVRYGESGRFSISHPL